MPTLTAAARTTLYARESGLSKAVITRYRVRPVRTWTTRRDRKFGGTVRALERMAENENLPLDAFVSVVEAVLGAMREFIEGTIVSLERLAESIASAVERVSLALKPWLPVIRDGLALITMIWVAQQGTGQAGRLA